jgi:hypothetical protein
VIIISIVIIGGMDRMRDYPLLFSSSKSKVNRIIFLIRYLRNLLFTSQLNIIIKFIKKLLFILERANLVVDKQKWAELF